MMKNLREWAKDQPIKGVPMTTSLFNKPKMRSEPLGVVLIIGYDYISLNEIARAGVGAFLEHGLDRTRTEDGSSFLNCSSSCPIHAVRSL